MSGRGSPAVYGGDYNPGDDQFALNVVASIRGRISDLHMTDNEELCSAAMAFSNASSPLTDNLKHSKKPERKKTEFFQKPLTLEQARNQALRFGVGSVGAANHRTSSSWGFFNLNMDTRDQDGRRDYEDVTDADILNAPICDVCIVQAKTVPPPGFYRVHKTPSNKKADINTSSGGNPLYLCIKKDLSGTLYPITNFIVVFPDRNEYTPPGFAVVNRGKTACNLNSGTSAERVFLCYRKEPAGNPVIDLQIILPTKGETPPAAFNIIEKSISGVAANLNSGTGGPDVYLTYRQKMTRLSCLLHEPVAAEEEAAHMQTRLRMRRHTLKSFDDSEKSAAAAGLLVGAPQGDAVAAPPGSAVPGRPQSVNMQPVSINSLTGQAAMRMRSVSAVAPGTLPSPPHRTGSFMEHAHATSMGPAVGHGALPQSIIYNMPQALPPAYFHRGGAPLTPTTKAGIARSSNSSSPAFKLGDVGNDADGRALQSIRPRSLNGLSGLNTAHSVSFSESVCDSPATAQSSVNTFNPSEPGLTPVPTPLGHVQGTLSNSASMEGLDESGRERASTSTTITGAHNDTVTNDTDSRAGRIDIERADSDMPLSTAEGVASVRSRRGTAYAEYEQPFENVVSDGEEDEEYAQEMAYLLEQMQQSKRLEVVDCYGNVPPLARRKALLAILSALYIRQGTAANAALAGLGDLLRDSHFFAMDLQRLPAQGTTTMIDLTVEAVCDRFELSADGERDALLKFLGQVTPYCGSQLSLVSLQRIFSATAFLCCHYAITQPALLEASLGTFTLDADNYDDYDMKNAGMPSFKLLSQLMTDTFAKIEVEDIADRLPSHDTFELDDASSVTSSSVAGAASNFPGLGAGLSALAIHSQAALDVREIVDEFVADVLDSLEVARLSEVALLTVSKQSYSTISPPFWKELHALAYSLFEGHGYRSSFLLLGAVCKQAWHNVRTKNVGEPVARDVGVKLVALGALENFCLLTGENMRNSKIFGYQIRRIVIPCLLYNVSFAFMDHRIFSKLLRIISALWRNWRRHMRMEFAILCEQFIFKVLQATVVQVKPIFKMIMIQEVTKWFEQPHLLLEMFVNYDMDRRFVSHWNTFSYLVRTFCAIGRRVIFSSKMASEEAAAATTTAATAAADDVDGDKVEKSVTIRDVHMQALEEVARIAKTLMDASGHAYLIMQDSGFRTKSIARDGGWVEDDDSSSAKTGPSRPVSTVSGGVPDADSATQSPGGTVASADSEATGTTHRKRMGSIKLKREAHQESEALIKKAIEIYNTKNDLKKAVDYLIKHEFLPNTPQEIANFLRLYKNSFDPSAIGDFLGEGGKTKAEEEHWSNIRFRYTRAVSFVEMDLEPALRLYLTGCGFRMPGEAQKIDRFVDVFMKAFWQDNSGTEYCPFKKEDTIHLLAYAIIILNVNLNNPNLNKKGKKSQRMTKDEFLKQLRGVDDGSDIDKDYLSRIYDNIAAQAIELVVKSPTSKSTDETAVSNPHYYSAAGVPPETRALEEKKFVRELCSSLRDSEDLLRSLSHFMYPFVETKISMDLVSFMFESVWFHFHSAAEALLNAASVDVFVKVTALDILSYALTCSIFLDLKVERMTLAGLLNDFRIVCESLPYASNVQRSPKIPDNSWYEDVENAFPASALETISKLHHLFVYLKEILQENEHYEQTRQIADKFEKKVKIMENNLYFIRQGELSKMSRGKRATTYWFFLFSDQLIYAHANRAQYVVHEELSLLDLQISDIAADPTMCSFQVDHPVKSFMVTADSPSTKQAWMRDIAQAIASCRKRKQLKSASSGDVRRLSMIGRIESQKAAQLQEQESVQRAQSRNFVYKGDGEVSPMMSPLSGASNKRVSFTGQSTPVSGDTPGASGAGGETGSTRSPFQDLRQSAKQSLMADEEGEGSPDGGRLSYASPTVSSSAPSTSASPPAPKHMLSGVFSSIDAEGAEHDKKGLLS